MPCIFRVKHNGVYFCGKRLPLACNAGICPFGALYYELVKNDQQTSRLWILPKMRQIDMREFHPDMIQAGDYVLKSITLKTQKTANVVKRSP